MINEGFFEPEVTGLDLELAKNDIRWVANALEATYRPGRTPLGYKVLWSELYESEIDAALLTGTELVMKRQIEPKVILDMAVKSRSLQDATMELGRLDAAIDMAIGAEND